MRRIRLTQGKYTLIDNEDFERLNLQKWYFHSTGYAVRTDNKNKKGIYLHRFILNTSKKIETDHINGNKLDNRKSNLRVCTMMQNRKNRRKQCGVYSNYKGVYWSKGSKKWFVSITSNKKRFYLGLFKNKIKAAIAYDKKSLEVHREFAKPNFICV